MIKGLDVQALHGCIQRYNWNGSHLDVAAGIISSTILTHPFPNANHRTSIVLARLYLESIGIRWPHYELRGGGAKRLYRDTYEFMRDSKYLLQLLRHKNLVQVAFEEGFRHLGIGPETDAEIRASDLNLSTEEIRAKHVARSQKLIDDLADPKLRKTLARPNKSRLREWVARMD